jgi:hypothetical protein
MAISNDCADRITDEISELAVARFNLIFTQPRRGANSSSEYGIMHVIPCCWSNARVCEILFLCSAMTREKGPVLSGLGVHNVATTTSASSCYSWSSKAEKSFGSSPSTGSSTDRTLRSATSFPPTASAQNSPCSLDLGDSLDTQPRLMEPDSLPICFSPRGSALRQGPANHDSWALVGSR